MKTYEIIQVVEMSVKWKVRAANADEANDAATRRTLDLCGALARKCKNTAFGDVSADYVPAMDEE